MITLYTGGKDNTLRLWQTKLNDNGDEQSNAVEGDLKRILYLENKEEEKKDEGGGINKIAYN
jgi:hypothetical protein